MDIDRQDAKGTPLYMRAQHRAVEAEFPQWNLINLPPPPAAFFFVKVSRLQAGYLELQREEYKKMFLEFADDDATVSAKEVPRAKQLGQKCSYR